MDECSKNPKPYHIELRRDTGIQEILLEDDIHAPSPPAAQRTLVTWRDEFRRSHPGEGRLIGVCTHNWTSETIYQDIPGYTEPGQPGQEGQEVWRIRQIVEEATRQTEVSEDDYSVAAAEHLDSLHQALHIVTDKVLLWPTFRKFPETDERIRVSKQLGRLIRSLARHGIEPIEDV